MIDERFSADAFRAMGVDTKGARALADELSEVVAALVHESMRPIVAGVVARLNELGHELRESAPTDAGQFDYRDERTDNEGLHARLRLGIDVVVSTGYAHNWTVEEVLEDVRSLNKAGRKRRSRRR